MADTNRIYSIDVMRGLSLFLMLFLNDLYMPGVPEWFGHSAADFDGMGLADWVLPGFLFIVGMVIPYSIGKKIADGQNNISIARHIITRTVSLLIIGVLMVNSERVNPEFTGIGKNIWAILMYIGVFLIWNKYPENDRNFFTIAGLRLAGIAVLVALVYIFRSGEFENNGSLIIGSWGILGIIGWGYLITTLIYLAARNNILSTIVAFLFFLILNILSNIDLMKPLEPLKPIFGVIIEGNVPLLVISGLLTTLILKKYLNSGSLAPIVTIVTIGIISIIAGFILRKWFIISSIHSTPSWGLICNGISMLVFVILYWIIDIRKQARWTLLLRTIGQNSLSTYLVPYILYNIIWSIGTSILFYKQSGVAIIVMAGSFIWAIMMVGLTVLLVRFNIKLKV